MSHRIDIDRLKVVSPCVADWGTMVGDEQIRFCRQCNKHIYNTAEMTRLQIENLIKITGGQFCANLVRLSDGQLLTQPDPARVRRWRASRWASAFVTAVLGLNASAPAQTSSPQTPAPAVVSSTGQKTDATAQRSATGDSLYGTVFDYQQAVIENATVTLINERTNQTQSAKTSDEGQFHFSNIEAGLYTIKVESPNFRLFTKTHLGIKPDVSLRLDATLEVVAMGEVVLVVKKPSPVWAAPFKWLKRVFGNS